MHDISDLNEELPSSKSLLEATLIALALAGSILLLAVLPAEYGIDPTGLGEKMGLTALNQQPEQAKAVARISAPQEMATTGPLQTSAVAPRMEKRQLVLLPGQGVELKAVMDAGQSYVFNWVSDGGEVYFDMHGQQPGAASDDYTSYWIDQSSSASGQYRADFAGDHGWYWENRGDKPVQINLQISGFYQELYMP